MRAATAATLQTAPVTPTTRNVSQRAQSARGISLDAYERTLQF